MGSGVYRAVAQLEFVNTTAYRASMLLSLITGPIFIATQYFIWTAVFSQTESVGQYTFSGIFTYAILVMLMMYLIYANPDERIGKRVHEGDMHAVLLRPISLMGEQLSIVLGHRSMAVLIELIPITMIVALLFGPALLIPKSNILFIILGVLIAILIEFLIKYIVGLAAFWTQTIHGIRMLLWPLRLLLTGMLIPLDLAPLWAQNILFFLPFTHVVYAPVSYFLGTYNLAGVTNPLVSLAYGVFWTCVLFVCAHNIQKRAYNKYQGVGQ